MQTDREPMMDVERLFSIEAEQFTLGGIMINPERFEDVAAIVSHKDFFRLENRRIFEAMTDIQNRGDTLDLGLLADHLEKTHRDTNWWVICATISKNTPSDYNVTAYAAKVAEYYKLRMMYQAGMVIQTLAMDANRTLTERLEAAHEQLNALSANTSEQGPRWIRDGMRKFLEHLDKCRMAEGGITGLPSGYSNFDERLGGLHPGSLIVIAGRPAMGKSVVGLNMARHAVFALGKAAIYFSLEMPEEELIGRLTADFCNLPYDKVRRADFDEEEWPKLTHLVGNSKDSDLIIDQTPALSISQIISRAKRIQRIKNLSLIVVDHMHLVEADGENEVIRVGKVSAGLKRLAKELNCPVVALCQLNRKCDDRPNRRPVMSDLRQSGNIEQDADVIAFVYRDVVYNADTPYPEVMELISRKVRGGQTGTDWFKSQLAFCRFVPGEEPADVIDQKPYAWNRRKQL